MNPLIFLLTSGQLLINLHCSSSAKILVFLPTFWRSHQFIFRPIARELAMRGHEVDFYTPLPMDNPPSNLTQFVVTDRQQESLENFKNVETQNVPLFRVQSIVTELHAAVLEKTFTLDMASIDLLQSNKKYDAIITDYPTGAEGTAYLAHKFKGALNIVILPFTDHPWLNELAGLPDNPSYMVSYRYPTNADKWTFWQRLKNVYTTTSILAAAYLDVWTIHQPHADRYIRYDGWETRPKLTNVLSDIALILTNSHVSTAYPYPKAPHVKEISGVHIEKQGLPKLIALQEFMDDAPHGIIYFSLGTVIDSKSMLADGRFQLYVNVFKRLKQKVLWKAAAGMSVVDDPKIKLQTWFPQQAILSHRNTVLFITHGGIQSMIEAIANGVPCLGMPVMFDQMKDVSFMETTGTGRLLSFSNLTETSLSWSIDEMLTNPRYRRQASKQKALFYDRPMKPLDEAIYWIEYVLRHGKILQPASVHMPFYEVYLLDVLGAIVALLVATFYVAKTTIIGAIRSSSLRSPERK